jgi:uncharacterized protein (TIGR02246 family)
MVSVYAEDIDHVNAFGEWHRGKEAIKAALTLFHASSKKDLTKTHRVEKIRFLKPDVAVAQVSQSSTVGNIGTWVLTKEAGKWLVVSFSNVEARPLPTAVMDSASNRK